MKIPSPVSPRIVGAAVLLPCIGLFLMMPPLIQLFTLDRDVLGVPLIVIYLFGVWIALVGCAAWLSRRLGASS